MRLLSVSAASMAAGGRRTLDDADEDADDLEAEEDAGEEDGDYVPEDLAEEEARLRSGRAAAGAGFADEQQAPVSLSESRFKKLDVLLERTGLYSQFLSEQMNAIVEEVDADANARAAGAGKRKGPESGPPPKACVEGGLKFGDQQEGEGAEFLRRQRVQQLEGEKEL